MTDHFIEGLRMSIEHNDAAIGFLNDDNMRWLAQSIAKRNGIRRDESRRDWFEADDIDGRIEEYTEDAVRLLLKSWWGMFGDIPIDDDERLEEPFMGWPEGTDYLEVWHWFDAMYQGGVAGLMGVKEDLIEKPNKIPPNFKPVWLKHEED